MGMRQVIMPKRVSRDLAAVQRRREERQQASPRLVATAVPPSSDRLDGDGLQFHMDMDTDESAGPSVPHLAGPSPPPARQHVSLAEVSLLKGGLPPPMLPAQRRPQQQLSRRGSFDSDAERAAGFGDSNGHTRLSLRQTTPRGRRPLRHDQISRRRASPP